MADIDPYGYGDASDEDRLRFLRQQYANAAVAKRVSTDSDSVERQDLKQLAAEIDRLEDKLRRKNRMHRVYAQRAARG